MSGCPFCGIVAGREPAQILRVWPDAIAIRPLNPIAPDHVLVIPRVHVTDATTDPEVTARAARRAAQIARPGQHITVNIGPEAGQTICHLHWHVFTCLGGRCMPWGCPKPSSNGKRIRVRPAHLLSRSMRRRLRPASPHPEDEEPLLLESPDLTPVAGYLADIGWTLRGDRLTCPQHST